MCLDYYSMYSESNATPPQPPPEAQGDELYQSGLRILARIIARAYRREYRAQDIRTCDEGIQQDQESDLKQ